MNSLLAGAVVTIAAVAGFVLYAIYEDPASKPLPDPVYNNIDYSDLVARPMEASIARTVQNLPERNCLALEDDDGLPVPATYFVQADEAALTSFESGQADPDYITTFESASLQMSNDEAVKMLQRYQFNSTIMQTRQNFLQIADNTYLFDCFFEYNGNQYYVRAFFGTYYPNVGKFVTVNITRGDAGVPVIENPSILISSTDVNGTVLFVNKLDADVVLKYKDVESGPAGEMQIMENEKTIPADKMFAVAFAQRAPVNDTYSFSYSVDPYGVKGEVIKKPHPVCIKDVAEARSYYAPYAELKFPSYLPEGYEPKCGLHASSYRFYATYANKDLRDYPDDKAVFAAEFLAKGGLRVSYLNYWVSEFWGEFPSYDKENMVKQYSGNPDSKIEYLDGNPVVISKIERSDNSGNYLVNHATLFLERESYDIESGSLSQEELLRILGSLQ